MRGRFVVALVALVTAGCAYAGSPGQDSVTFNSGLQPDTVARIADAYLARSGFTVVKQSPRVLTTAPKGIPAGADSDATTGHRFRYYILRVDAANSLMQSGTDVRIAGFYIPDAPATTTRVVDSAGVMRAVPITAANAKLFAQIDALATKLKELTVR